MLLLKNLLFTVVVPGTVAGWLPWWIARGPAPGVGVARAAAVVLFAVGTSAYGWCLWDFATFGRGTPAPVDAPRRLVVRGLYRYTRNPMYIGVLTVVSGWVVLFQAVGLVAYLLFVAGCFHGMVVLHEEPRLERVFGKQYADYRARVGRWWPRLGRRDSGVG